MAFKIGVLTGIVVGLLIVVLLLKKRVVCKEFDERQELARGKAFQYAFFTLLGCVLVLGCVDQLDAMARGMLSICIAITVFAITAIRKDAYLSLYENPRTVMILFAVLAAFNLLLGIRSALDGKLVENGVLTFRVTNLLLAVMLVVIMVAYGLRCLSRREEEDE
jgi:4-amino-4-deoxy-L-arabinose transferase-like glycosyltransferase